MTDIDMERAMLSIAVPREMNWRPYLVGAGIGVLSWVVFAVVAAPIGITTAMSQIAGGVAGAVIGAEAVAQNAYWKSLPMRLDYGVTLSDVTGLPLIVLLFALAVMAMTLFVAVERGTRGR